MRRLMRAAVLRPRRALAAFALLVLALGVAGHDLESRLTPTVLDIPGTESDHAADLYSAEFGDGITIPVLLEGPGAALDEQGPRLVEQLRRRSDFRVLSAWDRGPAGDALRPRDDRALIVVAVDQPYERAVEGGLADVRREVARATAPPVRPRVTGLAAIGTGVKEASLDSVARAERIAVPILVLVLLAVFRSLVAAAIPAVVGGVAVLAGMGGLSLLTRLTQIDAIAISLASMMGLALGVDYSLLLVSRFREELRTGADPRAAGLTTVDTAGRTVLFAAAVLAAAMLVALLVAPGDLLVSASLGVLVAVAVSLVSAVIGIPAVLVLLGGGIDRGWIGRRPREAGATSAAARAAMATLRRPAVPALLVLGALLLASTPALALKTGPPDVRMLPADSPVRQDFEAVSDAMGAGWTTPYEVVLRVREGAVTQPDRLEAMRRWQERIAGQPGVAGVIGPGAIAARVPDAPGGDLGAAGRRLERGRRDLARLENGLERAGDGVQELRAGLADAAGGAARLAEGGQAAAGGAELVRAGIARAAAGAERLAGGLAAAETGGSRIAGGAGETAAGARRLAREMAGAHADLTRGLERARGLPAGLRSGAEDLGRLREPARTVERELRTAFRALERMTVGKADPRYLEALRATATALGAATGRHPVTGQRVRPGYEGLDASLADAQAGAGRAAAGAQELLAGIERLARGLGELAAGARDLRAGAARLHAGTRRLAGALGRLAAGGSDLSSGLTRLSAGAGRLDGGVGRLVQGAERLHGGLDAGSRRTAELEEGLRSGERRVGRGRGRLVRADVAGLVKSARRSPGLFDSGYFTLAALDGARPGDRAGAEFAVSLARGGQAARIMVVPETGPNEEATARVGERLRGEADALARQVGGDAAVGGAASFLDDYDRATSGRFPLLVLGIVVASYLVLVPVFRSLLLPAIAVVLNLVTVGAAFGVLALLFQGGGPLADAGFIDAVSASGVFCVLFGLSIDYQVFLITRMREGWELTGVTEHAIAYGLERTAAVVTGAAGIMLGVFCAFAFTDVASIQQFGLGLALAVLIDATVVRLVLLPAAMRAGGRACWWLPRRLERLLPRLDVDGPQAAGRSRA